MENAVKELERHLKEYSKDREDCNQAILCKNSGKKVPKNNPFAGDSLEELNYRLREISLEIRIIKWKLKNPEY